MSSSFNLNMLRYVFSRSSPTRAERLLGIRQSALRAGSMFRRVFLSSRLSTAVINARTRRVRRRGTLQLRADRLYFTRRNVAICHLG